jgi:hypothetical protein
MISKRSGREKWCTWDFRAHCWTGMLMGFIGYIFPFLHSCAFPFLVFIFWGQGTVGAWMPNDTHVFNDE